jgi:hypothetical protein
VLVRKYHLSRLQYNNKQRCVYKVDIKINEHVGGNHIVIVALDDMVVKIANRGE